MNLVFAMDELAIADVIRCGNIALCPIRQIGKTHILLSIIRESHPSVAVANPKVFIVVPHQAQALSVQRQWDVSVRPGTEHPDVEVVCSAGSLERRMRGLPRQIPVYFDEYMNLEESERHKFFKLEKDLLGTLKFCGGTATFRG